MLLGTIIYMDVIDIAFFLCIPVSWPYVWVKDTISSNISYKSNKK